MWLGYLKICPSFLCLCILLSRSLYFYFINWSFQLQNFYSDFLMISIFMSPIPPISFNYLYFLLSCWIFLGSLLWILFLAFYRIFCKSRYYVIVSHYGIGIHKQRLCSVSMLFHTYLYVGMKTYYVCFTSSIFSFKCWLYHLRFFNMENIYF